MKGGVIIFVRELLTRLKNSDKIGIICEDVLLSYRKWNLYSEKLSVEIINNENSKIIGLFLPNGIAYAVSYFACLFSKKVVAPFYIDGATNELLYTIKQCAISTIITTEKYFSCIEEIALKHNLFMNIIIVNNYGEVEKIVKLNNPILPTKHSNEKELKDVVVLLHTSGTTSRPKRVMLTNSGLINNIKAHCASLDLDDKEISLVQLPMMFGYCHTAQFLAHIFLNACIVINPKPFFVTDFYKLVEKWHITNFTAVPSMLIALLRSKNIPYDISSLKIVCFGGAPFSKTKLLELVDKFPSIAFIQTYGMTEAGPRVTTVPRDRATDKIGSVGQAIPGVLIRIVDTFGDTLPTGMIGEVIVKSKGVMKGYYKGENETKKLLYDGWLHTGDLGYLSDSGFLYLVGRIKNIIISGGKNINPEEVERVISSCSGVVDVKVYGVQDELYGEIVCADIVLEINDVETVQHIKSVCLENLSRYKIPKRFNVVDSISKTYNGKTRRVVGEIGYDF